MSLIGTKDSVFRNWKGGSVLITDAGWGDSGKGKTISYLQPQLGARCIGGHNAGHTVVTDKGEFGLGIIPSTIVASGSKNVVGQEVVINPIFLVSEIKSLRKRGVLISPNNLTIDEGSHLVMPWHEVRDALSEESKGGGAIGSLHLGVGWAYVDRLDRRGLRVGDLLKSDVANIIKNELKRQLGVIKEMQLRVKLATGKKSKFKIDLNEKAILSKTVEAAKELSGLIGNTKIIIDKAIRRNDKVLFEDAHGMMLDLSHGSWPYTTGVNVGLGGVIRSFGGSAARSINKIVVSVKAYQTRVGGGPMPTEDHSKLGKHLVKYGDERGTRSKRVRRCGPIDIPLLKYGLSTIGVRGDDEIALTKLDVLDNLKEIPICVAYNVKGKLYKKIPTASSEFLSRAKPVYVNLPGWMTNTTKIRDFNKLPLEAKEYITFIRLLLDQPITMIGVGKHKDDVVIT